MANIDPVRRAEIGREKRARTRAQLIAAASALFARRAVELGGTVSAEHGLGKRKRGLLEIQYSAAEIEAMKAVKRRLDPAGILNPGNLFASI